LGGTTSVESIRLETELREIAGKQVLDVVGEIDVYTAPKFKAAVNDILASGQKHLVVNMARVTYMDSSGFGILLSATKRLRPNGGTVNLVKCTPAIDRILRITRLDTIFSVHDSVETAVESLPKD
jgi:anti-sigma B factor antagonist